MLPLRDQEPKKKKKLAEVSNVNVLGSVKFNSQHLQHNVDFQRNSFNLFLVSNDKLLMLNTERVTNR